MEITINFWTLFNAKVTESFSNKVVLIYDEDGSCYGDESEYVPGLSVRTFIFDDITSAESFLEDSDLDIFGSFTHMYVNGIEDKSLIYKLRG